MSKLLFNVCNRSYHYDSRSTRNTIFALSTTISSHKGSPLGVVRISGDKTAPAIEEFTRRSVAGSSIHNNTSRKLIQPRVATLTKFFEPRTEELIDLGLVLWFPKPKSYTGEDVCEFHLHGSHAVIKKVLTNLGSMDGLRPAEPGEFTKRAVQNEKMSIMQAESLPDLIASRTECQRKRALKGLHETTRHIYEQWIDMLIGILAHIEASIDFGEDQLIGDQDIVDGCLQRVSNLCDEITSFIDIASKSKDLVQDGFRIVLLGKPNAGKSSFMNLMCQTDRSIVSELSGTTRDVVEHTLELGDHCVTIYDTAGIKDVSDISYQGHEALNISHATIEKEGIRRALNAAERADMIIYLVDGEDVNSSGDLLEDIKSVLSSLGDMDRLTTFHIVLNKMDLNWAREIDSSTMQHGLPGVNVVVTPISCKTKQNYDLLLDKICLDLDQSIEKEYGLGAIDVLDYTNERHLSLLKMTSQHLGLAKQMDDRSLDQVAQHVRESINYMSRIVGSVSNEQVMDVVFRDFCIGK